MLPAVLPIPRSLRVEALLLADDGLAILASSEAADVRCPLCGQRSDRVHSRYVRALADLPWAGSAVQLRVRVRRCFCDNDACPRRIFVERLDGVAVAHARRTDRQREALTAIAVVLGGEAGARLAADLGYAVSPDTLLRLIRGAPDVAFPIPAVLGVDDWAYRKGRHYGTILVDLERHRPIDLLPDRASGSLAAWLRAHPGVAVVTRDRAGAYAEGAREGAPDAVQVADRWHLVDNLVDALEAFLVPKGACRQAAAAALARQLGATGPPRPPPDEPYQGKRRHPQPERWRQRMDAVAEARVAPRRANWERVRALRAEGMNIAAIARAVGVSRMTVYAYLRRGPPQRWHVTRRGERRVLEPYEPYLLRRWVEGCHVAAQLCREIRALGYAHSERTVALFATRLRRKGMPCPGRRPNAPLTRIEGPSARHVATLLVQRPEKRTVDQTAYLAHLAQTDPAIAAAATLGGDFLAMLRRREGERLPAWLEEVSRSGVEELERFAAKLKEDLPAVQAGLTLRHSNGQTEGQVNRLKLIKRQGYGRAKFDLLRQRVLRAA